MSPSMAERSRGRGGNGKDDGRHLVWVGTSDPLTLRVEVAPGASASVRAQAFYMGSDVPVDHVLAQLPPWSAPTVQTVLEARLEF